VKIYLHYLVRVLGLSLAAWLILKPEWSVTAPDGFELHLARWIWQGPAPRPGWTINGINWPSTLFSAAALVMLTWSFFGPIDRRVGASQHAQAADDRRSGARG
jgi:hypothetical protein